MDADRATPAPEKIVLHLQSQFLELEWHGCPARRLPAQLLRNQCPCSQCEAARIKSGLRAPAAAIGGIEPVGEYGLRIVFTDGHDQGIFPWSYLLQLQPD
jgi:DUF971 family protein